jgi:hypothetical protein
MKETCLINKLIKWGKSELYTLKFWGSRTEILHFRLLIPFPATKAVS